MHLSWILQCRKIRQHPELTAQMHLADKGEMEPSTPQAARDIPSGPSGMEEIGLVYSIILFACFRVLSHLGVVESIVCPLFV